MKSNKSICMCGVLREILNTTYSFTGDGDSIFVHLSFLSLFRLHLIKQSLLNAQAAREDSVLPHVSASP